MKTVEQFREELYTKFGKRLIVPEDAVYLGNKKDIKVICPKHGEKWMRPNNLLSGARCRDCAYEEVSKKNANTPEIFLEKAHKAHNDEYEYPFIYEEYGKREKIHIFCKKCGKIFEQKPSLHLFGNGCSHCNQFPKRYTTETLKEAIHKKHPQIDLISEYIGDNDSEITVKCTKHNISWKTTPHRLIQQKHGCKKCYSEDRILKIREKQSKKFYEFVNTHYAPLYDVSKVEYINEKTDVTLVCPKHGEFKLKPSKMLYRFDGCPYCGESHLERETRILLDELKIDWEREKTFTWLKNKTYLPLDFYLPKYNVAIECQGEQHVVKRNNSIMNKCDKFEEKVHRDKLKHKLCTEREIHIIYIFNKFHSSNRLNEEFNHMYDDALFIEDILKNPQILLNEIIKQNEQPK